MAAGKKNAAILNAHIVFLDESGFLLIPTVRRTWAPRGRTPTHRHRYRRDKISAISGISVSPARRRVGLYYRFHDDNIDNVRAADFLRHLLRHLRGHVFVIWDNGRHHRGPAIAEVRRRFPRLHLERFPPYAPELNPDEGVWALLKGTLANGRPDDRDELRAHLADAAADLRRSHLNLRGCIRGSDLPFRLP